MSFSYYDQSYEKRNNSSSIPLTAEKSPSRLYQQRESENNYTPSRFNKKPNQKLSSLKKGIDQCIKSMSNKKQMNRQALLQVKNLNHQVQDYLSKSHDPIRKQSSQYQNQQQPNYMQTSYQPRNIYRDNINTSGFDLGNTYQPIESNNFQRSQVYRQQTPINYQQNSKIKLQEERKRNIKLQQNVERLRNQNKYLRTSGTMANTPLRTTYTVNDALTESLLRENAQLRRQLQRVQNYSQYSLNEVQQQFKLLKQENDRLRKDTLHILKK